MSDKWSLKDKKWGGCEYHASDIETLRRKLIEELCFEYIFEKRNHRHQVEITQKIIYEVVNELFGVSKSRVKPDPRLTEYYPMG